MYPPVVFIKDNEKTEGSAINCPPSNKKVSSRSVAKEQLAPAITSAEINGDVMMWFFGCDGIEFGHVFWIMLTYDLEKPTLIK